MAAPVAQRELTDAEVFGPDPETDALVRTVWGEARGEDATGRKAVAAVIRNRAKASGQPISAVVRAPGQFEPWSDPSVRPLLEKLDPTSDEYQAVLRDIQGDDDPTFGATHFYAPKAQAARGRPPPDWDNGQGFDIGSHRFFRIGYNDQPPPSRGRELSDAEVFGAASPNLEAAQEGAPDDPFGGAQFISQPKSAMQTDARFVDAETGEPLTAAQAAVYDAEIQAGRLDPAKVRAGEVRGGSEAFPLAQRDPKDLPKPGAWYLSPEGEKRQVPEPSVAETAINLGVKFIPGLGPLDILLKDDARTDAVERALQSGVLLGGRNEAVAGIASLPKIDEGWGATKGRFSDVLNREDRASGQARRDFPAAYDTAATLGALGSAIATPPGLLPRLATSGGAGFLSTDGSVGERAIGAGLGIAGGEVLNAALPRLVGAAANAINLPRRVAPETVEAADETLRRLGADRASLRPEAQSYLAEQLRRGVEPSDAAVLALNEGLPVRIPLRRGDVTGLPEDQFAFNAALRGARGAPAASDAQGVVAAQQAAMREMVDRLGGSMAGGGDAIPRRGRGGQLVSDALFGERVAQKAGVDKAYETARASDGAAMLPSYDAQVLSARMADAVADYDPARVGSVSKELFALDGAAGADVGVRDLFNMRSRLSSLRASNDGVEAGAAGKAIKAFDSYIQGALEDDLFRGDVGAVAAWRNAIKSARDFAEVFKQGDLVDRLTQEIGTGGQRRLAVDPGDAANYIFNRSALGAVGRRDLYRDLVKVRDVLTESGQGESWDALRSEAFMRIAGAGNAGVEGGAQQFSGAKFLSAWNKAKSEDPRLINLLFKPEEKATIDQFAALSARVTSPVKGGDNPSNTALALGALKKLGGFAFTVGKMTPFVHQAFGVIEEAAQRSAAARAMKPTPRRSPLPMRQLPARAGGQIGATAVEAQR